MKEAVIGSMNGVEGTTWSADFISLNITHQEPLDFEPELCRERIRADTSGLQRNYIMTILTSTP